MPRRRIHDAALAVPLSLAGTSDGDEWAAGLVGATVVVALLIAFGAIARSAADRAVTLLRR